jgi:hypothetical protein
MEWFRHDSNANLDEKLQEVLLDYGLEGYGLYWYCIELIVGKTSADNITFELKHDARVIARNTNSTPQKVEEMMKRFITLGLFENEENKITCLKVAKRLMSSATSNPKMRHLIQDIKQQYDTALDTNRHDAIMTPSDFITAEEKRIEENRLEDKRPKNTTNKLSYELGYGWVNYQVFLEKAEVDFPYVDILKEFDKAGAWIKQKPSQRLKTDYNKFMLNWIKRVADVTPNPNEIFEGAI